MTLEEAIIKLKGNNLENIVLYKNKVIVYSGTILYLISKRKDLLREYLKDELNYSDDHGYSGELL